MPTSPPTDDRQLLERFLKSKDQAAFAQLVERYLPLVYSVALRITRQPQLAEEAGQDVFLKLVQNPPALMKGLPLAAWLHRATRCRAIDLLRAERRRAAREQAATLHPGEVAVLDAEALALLDEVIDRLPEAERRLVVGRFFLGHSLAALSAQAGSTEDAVRMRINRALEKMRVLFSRRGITTTAAVLATALPSQASTLPPQAMAASILKSAMKAGTAAAIPSSSLSFIYLMTTVQKSTIAGIVLLAAAIPAAIHISQDRNDPGKTGSAGSSSSSALPPATPPAAAPATRTARKELDAEYSTLAAKYGESETRRAQALASQGAGLVHDIATSDQVRLQADAQAKSELKNLTRELKLSPEQGESIKDIQAALLAKRGKDMQELATQVQQNLPALAEVFLAVDAKARGKIDDAAYREVLQGKAAALNVGAASPWEYMGMVGMKSVYKTQDPFAGSPELAQSFSAHLDPGQQKAYQEIRDTNAKFDAEPPNLENKDLDGLAGGVAGMGKLIEAMRLMTPEQISTGKKPE